MSYKLAGVIWNDDGTMATKELTPLEHLEFIRNYEIDDEHRTLNMNYATKQSLDIIENALKDIDYIKALRENQKRNMELLIEENRTMKKSFRALAIIKEKCNFISLDYDEDDDKYYIYDNELYMHNEITKEEYELLKEIYGC